VNLYIIHFNFGSFKGLKISHRLALKGYIVPIRSSRYTCAALASYLHPYRRPPE